MPMLLSLENPQIVIDLDCSFGGGELYIPGNWNVILRTDNSFGSIDDKRIPAGHIDHEHELIIRGDVSFGGVEIKS